jgi:hypothetical protein
MVHIAPYLPSFTYSKNRPIRLWQHTNVELLSWLVASFSSRRTGLDPSTVRVEFMLDAVSLGWVFLRLFWPYLVAIIPHILHTHN